MTEKPDPRVSRAILRLGVLVFGAIVALVFVIIVWALLHD
jgi:hypothetical protein